MPRPPVWNMPKKKIVQLAKWRCEHGETGLSHYNCYLRSNPDKEHLGFIDIESTNLAADFGIILCYCIADADSDTIYHRVITKGDLKDCLDKRVVEQCLKDMRKFDRLVGFYSTKFDIPFIRTRAVALGIEDFPEYGEIIHNDLYYAVRNKFRLSSNRLENACRILLGNTEKTRIESKYWIKALQGDVDSLAYILDHCKKDVTDLKKLYNKLIPYRKITDTSL